MAKRNFNSNVVDGELLDTAVKDLRAELGITARFPDAAWAEATAAAQSVDISGLADRRDIPFITIDPEGSRDLDQALHIEREGEGYLVRYAIAAVSLFVTPGGSLDEEVRRRGVTVYLPDRSIPLHPGPLSADAASLLPDVDRPAYLWYHHLTADGELIETWVEYAQVRSRAQLTYTQVQAAADGEGELPDVVPADMPQLLREVGQKREQIEIARGGVSLDLPEQRIEKTDDGYRLEFRHLTDVEGWNAQISLLTGIAAANLMIERNVGILRTLPKALRKDVLKLRRAARALGLDWPESMDYPDFVRSLDGNDPTALAFLTEATTLFRGAGYLALPVELEEGQKQPTLEHAAMATPYAHVTAPLRRLVDRYALEVCRCLCHGEEIPQWVRDMLPELPSIMGKATRAANQVENRAVAAAEALTLAGREGEEFNGLIVEILPRREKDAGQRAVVLMREPAIEAVVHGESFEAGSEVTVRLEHVDVEAGQVSFTLA